jgi:hypothetical protein
LVACCRRRRRRSRSLLGTKGVQGWVYLSVPGTVERQSKCECGSSCRVIHLLLVARPHSPALAFRTPALCIRPSRLSRSAGYEPNTIPAAAGPGFHGVLRPYPPSPNGVPPPLPQNRVIPPQLHQHAGIIPQPAGYPQPGQPLLVCQATHNQVQVSGEGRTQANGQPNGQQ